MACVVRNVSVVKHGETYSRYRLIAHCLLVLPDKASGAKHAIHGNILAVCHATALDDEHINLVQRDSSHLKVTEFYVLDRNVVIIVAVDTCDKHR